MKLGEKLLFQAGDTLPDCCFRHETVVHPHRRTTLAYVPRVFDDGVVDAVSNAVIAYAKV